MLHHNIVKEASGLFNTLLCFIIEIGVKTMFRDGFPKRAWTDSEKWILTIVAAIIVFIAQSFISEVVFKESDCHLPWEQQEDPEKCYE